MERYPSPKALPRARDLLGRGVLAAIAALFYGGIISVFMGDHQPLVQAVVIQTVFSVFFVLLIAPSLSRSWRPALLLGERPKPSVWRQNTFLVFPLVLVAIASMFLLYYPLSYVLPRFVEWQLSNQPRLMEGSNSIIANLLCFSYIVLIGPVFEEFVFRGLLLTRWSMKWNVRRAIFASSTLFALGHADIVGAFFVGYVLSVLYIKTKSLFVPISVHIVNNGIAWIFASANLLITGSDEQTTLAEFRSYWWMGLLATVIVAPWVVIFIKRHIPTDDWRVPYLALQDAEQVDEILPEVIRRRVA